MSLINSFPSGSGTGLPSGGTQGQVLTKQSATDGDADWDDIPHDNTKANSSSLAPVETSTTSEHAYEVGDHLMLAGGRFLVTADIAIGDTLDVSTNIQAVNLEDETGLSQADFAEIITPLPGKFVGGINYSTEEQVVGTWIDGKPLYQKSIVITSNFAQSFEVASDIDFIIDIKCARLSSNGNTSSYPYPPGAVSSYDAYVLSGYWNESEKKWYPQIGESTINILQKLFYTFRYTKTT